ncbi:MAG: hypothetical protein J7L45_02965 [Candidatus Aenigmarchaeota archaeon]|nr:hypothetical protein [Candidatus Aenigmarchaeota archaeon]
MNDIKKYTGEIKIIPERRTDEIDYWTLIVRNPLDENEKIVVRQGINPNIVGPDVSEVLGSLIDYNPDKEWEISKHIKAKVKGEITYKEFTPEYSSEVEKKLRELKIIE